MSLLANRMVYSKGWATKELPTLLALLQGLLTTFLVLHPSLGVYLPAFSKIKTSRASFIVPHSFNLPLSVPLGISGFFQLWLFPLGEFLRIHLMVPLVGVALFNLIYFLEFYLPKNSDLLQRRVPSVLVPFCLKGSFHLCLFPKDELLKEPYRGSLWQIGYLPPLDGFKILLPLRQMKKSVWISERTILKFV